VCLQSIYAAGRRGIRIAPIALGTWLATILGYAVCAGVAQAETSAADGEVTITEELIHSNLRRIGVNLGHRSWWGAGEQLIANLIRNPGFELIGLCGIFFIMRSILGDDH
jgi:hypothetical protein